MTPFQKIIVAAYRMLAIAVLLLILGTGVGYAFITLFYTLNTSWVAPVLLSPTSDRILQLKAGLFSNLEAVDTLTVELNTLTQENNVLALEQAETATFLKKALETEKQQSLEDATLANKLGPIARAKAADRSTTHQLISTVADQEASINRELKAGLLTKDDAVRALSTVNAFKVSSTNDDTAGAELDLEVSRLHNSAQTLKGHAATSATALDLLAKTSMYASQLARIELKQTENKAEITNKRQEQKQRQQLLATITDSPYYRATLAGTPLSYAFIPYSNAGNAKVGESVYDCALQILICKKVGTNKRMHHDEEVAQHPLFHTETRGFLVELSLTIPEAAKYKDLFIGSAPLLF